MFNSIAYVSITVEVYEDLCQVLPDGSNLAIFHAKYKRFQDCHHQLLSALKIVSKVEKSNQLYQAYENFSELYIYCFQIASHTEIV